MKLRETWTKTDKVLQADTNVFIIWIKLALQGGST